MSRLLARVRQFPSPFLSHSEALRTAELVRSYTRPRMKRRLSRRRLLGMTGGAAAMTALGAAGWRLSFDTTPAASQELVLIDEADPTATPRVFVATVEAPIETATPTPATPTPAPTPTPRLLARKPVWNSELLRQVASQGPSDRPYVALTIDDGWFSRDAVLEVLKAKGVQLTFFLAGRPIAGDYGFVSRALDAGFEIANHTMDHYDLTAKTAAYIRQDLVDFEDLVKAQVIGATTQPFMRPSGGALNQTVIDASAAAGYRPVLWSGSVGDGSASTTPAEMIDYGLKAAKPGAIILMHFSERAVVALPPLIDGLRAKGLEPVSLSKLFETAPVAG
jgi:peptidoglycan-N-acetylglucosamine deacetylase